jgi:outer membrane biogenesis lipoprotein LolB
MSAKFVAPVLLLALLSACVQDVSGAWSVLASCPKESKLGEVTVTATATMQETDKGVYKGSIINSFGQKGELDAVLDGKTMSVKVLWQGSGSTEALLSLVDADRTYVGNDTEGCSLRVRRP